MVLDQVILVFGTLFPIVNPFSTSLVFNKLAKGMPKSSRQVMAIVASFVAFLTLAIFLFIGQPILNFFGVTIYAFRVAGGIYLAWIGFQMLSPTLRRNPENYDDDKDSIAVIPLAIPLLAGPGSLTSVLVLSAELSWLPVLIGILIVSLISWLVLREASLIQKALGHTGTVVVERLLGIVVLSVALQFIFNGITGYLVAIA